MDQAGEMRQRALDIQRMATEAQAEVVSEEGEVRVVSAPGGRVKELDLRLNAFQLSGVELGELIVETLHAADAKVTAELTAAITRSMSGVDTLLGEGEEA
ncbi:YbaB/EbfC family nucleoid-associated protein [Glycomyces sp. NPDC046736]|uniref:YbaB/EbfC family nucleoid-associated protein n=1 Tax=Glycomyces sp. NPDC046736 TaxID=3155615 RepID=UPI0033EEFB60